MDIQYPSYEGPRAREAAIQRIPAELARLAEIDLNLPFSLMADTWDACLTTGQSYVDQATWAYTLVWAIRAYDADPLNYVQKTGFWGKRAEGPLI